MISYNIRAWPLLQRTLSDGSDWGKETVNLFMCVLGDLSIGVHNIHLCGEQERMCSNVH